MLGLNLTRDRSCLLPSVKCLTLSHDHFHCHSHTFIYIFTYGRDAVKHPERNKSDAEHRATPRDDCGSQSFSPFVSDAQLHALLRRIKSRAVNRWSVPGWIPSHYKKCSALSRGRAGKWSAGQHNVILCLSGHPLVQLRECAWCCSLYHQALYHHIMLFTASPGAVSPHYAVHCITRHSITTLCCTLHHQALYHHIMLYTVSPGAVSPHYAVHCITRRSITTWCRSLYHHNTLLYYLPNIHNNR
jgi:hypothetical protein